MTLEKTKLNFSLKENSSEQTFNLDQITTTLGRDLECDIVLTEGHPSRLHAQIITKNGKLLLDDLSSTNGTFVNNVRINSATAIRPGDTIKFCTGTFTVFTDDKQQDTIISKSLKTPETDNSFILIDPKNPEDTKLHQEYPLPYGWPADDTYTRKIFQHNKTAPDQAPIEELIRKQLADSEEVYIAALIFSSLGHQTVVYGLSLETKQNTITIGRNIKCSVTLNTPSVSEQHAEIRFKQGNWILKDTKSTNGIMMEQKRHEKITLKHGCQFSLGKVEVTFRDISWAI